MDNINENTHGAASNVFFLQTPDGEEYGPADLVTIQQWCQEGRIGPDQMISPDRIDWQPVTDIPELAFDWFIVLADGSEVGPFHLAMLEEQAQAGNLPDDCYFKHRHTQQILSLDDLAAATPPEQPPSQENAEADIRGSSEAPVASDDASESAEAETSAAPSPNAEDPEDELPLSLRLETVSQHAAEAREQLSATRATLQALRQDHTLLQDENQHLRERLTLLETEREEAENSLLKLQNQSAQNETELDNLRAQLAQMQEHYEKLQLENQRQFEQIDDLRAGALTSEQSWKRELSVLQSQMEAKNRVLTDVAAALAQDNIDIPRAPAPPEAKPSAPEAFSQPRQQMVEQLPPSQRKALPKAKPRAPLAPPPPRDTQFIKQVVVAAIIIFLVGLLGWGLFSIAMKAFTTLASRREARPAPAETEYVVASPSDVEEALVLQPEQARARGRRSQNRTVRQWPSINLPRASITQEENAMRITFNYGLFPSGTRLREEARQDLVQLAEQLRPQLAEFSVIVEGHTDTIPVRPDNERFIDNFSLGLARAEAVKHFLAEAGNLPTARIHTASAGQSSPPYPNDTPENRERNRTVVISIIP